MTDPRWTVVTHETTTSAHPYWRDRDGNDWRMRELSQPSMHYERRRAEDVLVVQLRESAEVPGLRAELDRIRPLIGMHDPTGADHMEDAARLATENDGLRARLAAAEAVIRVLEEHFDGGLILFPMVRRTQKWSIAEAEAIARERGDQP